MILSLIPALPGMSSASFHQSRRLRDTRSPGRAGGNQAPCRNDQTLEGRCVSLRMTGIRKGVIIVPGTFSRFTVRRSCLQERREQDLHGREMVQGTFDCCRNHEESQGCREDFPPPASGLVLEHGSLERSTCNGLSCPACA